MAFVTMTIDGGDEVRLYQFTDGSLSTLFDCPKCDSVDDADMDTGGVWSCSNCDATGTCDHSQTKIEVVTDDKLSPQFGHSQVDREIYVCIWCDAQVDGIPAEDREDCLVSMQVAEAVGK